MIKFSPTRAVLLAAALISLCIITRGQEASTLPAASATTTPQTPPAPAIKTAQVTYVASKLSVTASNSSLNQILRDISRQTGMKITGGVTEERVFGSYGPDTPSKVLNALLDGTGSNILLVQGTDGTSAPVELVLTPRQGGPTPPNPNARGFNDGAPSEAVDPNRGNTFNPPTTFPQPSVPVSGIQTAQPINSTAGSPVGDASNPAGSFPPPAPSSGFQTVPADAASPQSSPNDVKTPQQIYEQLLKLRQQTAAPK